MLTGNAFGSSIDGMNVIGTRPDGWWRDRDAAMARLVRELDALAARTGDEVAVAPKPVRDAADMEIARRVAADEAPASISSSDRALPLSRGAMIVGEIADLVSRPR